jgi:hypothetical protein
MADSNEEFQRIHQRHVKDLELIGRRIGDGSLDADGRTVATNEDELRPRLVRPLEEEIRAFVVELAQQLRLAKEPAVALKVAMDGMDGLDQKRFLLTNILEALKTGKNLAQTLRQYKKLGLIDIAEPDQGATSPTATPTTYTELPFQSGFARACQRIHRGMNQSAAKLSAVSINAVSAIPKLADVEVGLALCGGIPSLTFTAKKKDSLGLQDIADILADIVEA